MRRASLAGAVVFLIGWSVAFCPSYSRASSAEHQLHFSPKLKARTNSKMIGRTEPEGSAIGINEQQLTRESRVLAASKAKTRDNLQVRPYGNPPTGKLGFISATQIPAGGETFWSAVMGDFNGDGKPDIATIVGIYDSITSLTNPALSIVLGNGDGTFKAPVLTTISNPYFVAFAVGDVNGDKKDDVLLIYAAVLPNNSTFDVLLSNGDGTFTQKDTTPYTISPNSDVYAGMLAVTTKSGFLDLVAGDGTNVITVFGNGDGTFSPAPKVVPGGGTTFGDLNGDGILDAVGFSFESSTNNFELVVFLATSATAYAPATIYDITPNSNLYEAILGDLTNDGKPEIVVPNTSGTIAVYVNNGDGTFQPGVSYNAVLSGPNGAPGETYPTAVTIADVNGDGKADVVISNSYSGDVTILLGNGDGTLNVPTVGYAGGGGNPGNRSAAIVADFDGDGIVDIVVPDSRFSLAYLKGYNDGAFRATPTSYAPTTAFASGLASGDFNGDGIPDVVIASPESNYSAGFTVFLSRGDGTLKPGVTYGQGITYGTCSITYWTPNVVVADFNKDGQPDIGVTNSCAGEVQVFNGRSDGTFVPGPTVATGMSNTSPIDVVVGDFDGNGYPDIAVTNVVDVAVILNDGTGNFKPAVSYALSNYSYQGLAVGDLNGDGKLDLVVPFSNASSVAILLGVGDGTFTQPPDVSLGTPGSTTNCDMTGQLCPAAVSLADVNGDGNMDIIATLLDFDGGGRDIVILPGAGTTGGIPSFGTPLYLPSSLQTSTTGPSPAFIQVLDIDTDGNLDLVYTNGSYSTLGLIYGAGSGKFYDPVEYPVGFGAGRFAVADFNKDGTNDVMVVGGDFNGISVLLNAAGGGRKANYAVTAAPNAQTVTAGAIANFTLTMTPSNGYDGTITFSCAGLPDKASCTFNPTSALMDGLSSMTVQWGMTTVGATTTARLHRNVSFRLATSLSGIGLLGILFVGSLPKRRRLLGIMFGIVIVIMMIPLLACVSNDTTKTITNPGTPAGKYTVTLTATGTAGSYGGDTSPHSMTVTLTVQ